MVSVSLFEGIVLLAITGVFVVAWWGVKRIVKTNDDESAVLTKINASLTEICTRLKGIDVWAEMHTDMDDERHKENKDALKQLHEDIEVLEKLIGGKRNG